MNALKPFLLPSLCLMAADQLSKLIIFFFFMDAKADLLGSLLRFHPVQYTFLSYGGNFSPLLADKTILLLLNLTALFLLFSGYPLYFTKYFQTSFAVKIIMVCGMSGCACSLVDNLLWDGSFDFLQIPTGSPLT